MASFDDTTTSLVNRVQALNPLLDTMSLRLGRIVPGNPVIPGNPVRPAMVSVRESALGLIQTIDAARCGAAALEVAEDATSIVDADVFATDTSSQGLMNQLGSVSTVLRQANSRLARVVPGNPVSPADPILPALLAVRARAVGISDVMTVAINDDFSLSDTCAD